MSSDKPECFQPITGLRHEVAAEIDRIARKARLHFLTSEMGRVSREINANSRTHGSTETWRRGEELLAEMDRLDEEYEKLRNTK